MKYLFNEFTATFFLFLIVLGEVGGIYHAYTKHSKKDVLLAFCVPPVAWYLSIEFFWHDDYKNVDWEKKLGNDVRACLYFLGKYAEKNPDIYRLNSEIESFSKKINGYPEDKVEYLKNCTSTYIKWWDLLSDTLADSVKKSSVSGHFKFIKSPETMEMDEVLRSCSLGDIIELGDNTYELLTEKLNNTDTNRLQEKEFFEMWTFQNKQKFIVFQDTYKNLFNEDLPVLKQIDE